MAKTLFIWSEGQKYSKLSFSWAAVTPMTLNNRCWRMVFYYKQHRQTPLVFVPSEFPHEVWTLLEEIRAWCQLHLPIHQTGLILPVCCSLLQAMCGQSVFIWHFPPHCMFLQFQEEKKGSLSILTPPHHTDWFTPTFWAALSLLAKASNSLRLPAQPFVRCLSS